MADGSLCGDVIKYFNRAVKSHAAGKEGETASLVEEMHEILALHFPGEPTKAQLVRLVQAQRDFQGEQRKDAGLSYHALHKARPSVIPLLVAYELDRRQIPSEPQVGWGHWLNQFHALTGMVAQPYAV